MLNYRKQTLTYAMPWQEAGLDFLLIEDENYYAELKKVKAQIEAEVQKVAFTPKIEPEKNIQSSPRSSEEAKERNLEQSSSQLSILKEHEWPQDWENLWLKIAKHSSPKIAWTYTGLHDDLLGNANKVEQRQGIIRQLITGLNKANGTHTFVPYDKANDAGKLFTNEDNSFYWSAVSRFKVQHLFVFGSKARDELLMPTRGVNSVIPFKSYRIYLLPDINKLIGDTAGVKALLEYLKIQLSLVKI